MAGAPEIQRGHFAFRDTFFVDLGSGKRHPRAAESELRDLLLPKKSATAPAKDQVAHYYEAQLLHYGLPRTKDKNLAKVRLTQALSSGKMSVPDDVKKTETAMKKEWQAAVRKATKGATGSESKSTTPASGKKRKAADVEDGAKASRPKATPKKPKTDAAVKVTASSAASTPATKRTKKEAAAPARGAKTPARGRGTKATSAATARSTSKPSDTASKATNKAAARPKQTARRSGGFTANKPSYRPEPSPPFHDSDTLMEDADGYDYDRDDFDNEDDAPPPYDSLGFSSASNQSPARHQPAKGGTSSNVIQISGNYEVTATDSDSYDTFNNPTLMLVVDHATQELWGRLTLPGKLRCILSGEIPRDVTAAPVAVSWRAEDFETGQYMFRRENRGRLSFDGAGSLEGSVFGLVDGEDVLLEGELTHGYGAPQADELRGEWQAVARRAYGRQ